MCLPTRIWPRKYQKSARRVLSYITRGPFAQPFQLGVRGVKADPGRERHRPGKVLCTAGVACSSTRINGKKNGSERTEIDRLRRKQYGVQLQRHGHGGVLIDVQTSLSQPTLRDRRVLALASTYRSVHHHQHSHAHLYLTTTRESGHPPGTSGSPACVPSRFRPSHASHPLNPSLPSSFPIAPGTRPLYLPGPPDFTDHRRASDIARNNRKLPFSTSSLALHAPLHSSRLLCVSERALPKQPHLAHPPPARRTLHHLEP
jgi:hypothetical protein